MFPKVDNTRSKGFKTPCLCPSGAFEVLITCRVEQQPSPSQQLPPRVTSRPGQVTRSPEGATRPDKHKQPPTGAWTGEWTATVRHFGFIFFVVCLFVCLQLLMQCCNSLFLSPLLSTALTSRTVIHMWKLCWWKDSAFLSYLWRSNSLLVQLCRKINPFGLKWSDFLNLQTYWHVLILPCLTHWYLLPYKLPLCFFLPESFSADHKVHPSSALPGYDTQMQIYVCVFPPLIYRNNVVLLGSMKEHLNWIVSGSRRMRCTTVRGRRTLMAWVKTIEYAGKANFPRDTRAVK